MELEQLLPLSPPPEIWKSRAMRKRLDKHLAVFKEKWIAAPGEKKKRKAAEVRFSCCETVAYADWLEWDYSCSSGYAPGKHFGFSLSGNNYWKNEMIKCPSCGAICRAAHISSFGSAKKVTVNRLYPITFKRIGRRFAILAWFVEKKVTKEGAEEITTRPYEAYVAEGRKVLKFKGYRRFFNEISWLGCWERMKRAVDTYGACGGDGIVPFLPRKKDLDGTVMENSKLKQYMTICKDGFPIQYMRFYLKHPSVENLVTAGMSQLLTELIERDRTIRLNNRISWNKKRPCEMLYMNRQEMKVFRALYDNGDIGADAYIKFAILRKAGKQVKIEDMRTLRCFSIYDIDRLAGMEGVEAMKAIRYINRQRRRYPGDYITCGDYVDYLQMLRRNGEGRESIYPQRLKTAHDRMMEDDQKRKVAEDKEKMQARTNALKRFSFRKDGLLIRPAESLLELEKEGSALHHCVRSYYKRHLEAQTAIFFVRRESAPEKPFFTLEFDEKQKNVVQNRGKHNCDRTEDVQAFEDAWLAWIRAGQKKKGEDHGNHEHTRAYAG